MSLPDNSNPAASGGSINEMLTLTEHNDAVKSKVARKLERIKHQPAGVLCPECGEELVTTDGACQVDWPYSFWYVECPSCGHKGEKLR